MIKIRNTIRISCKYSLRIIVLLMIAALISSGCSARYIQSNSGFSPSNAPTSSEIKPTLFNTMTPNLSINEFIPTSTNATTPIPKENAQCLQPSEDYSKIESNGHILNQRTLEMLAYAQTLYDGEKDLAGDAITQGSYTDAVEASFGTHAGGGAVDLSVMAPGTYDILYADIPNLIQALRLAGFAAWYRDFNELYSGSPPHIHAIAIGDRELSITAREQLAGPFGYFWGYNGLPTEDKIPIRDPHGGPIVCEWMIEKGYPNKTATPGVEESSP